MSHLSNPDIHFLSEVVAEYSGNVIVERQAYMLEKQLKPIAVEAGLKDIFELVAELRQTRNPKLSTQVAEAVTVNETSFYRDAHPFEALKNSVLPSVIKANNSKRQLRIWCAACSAGQEPYTIAMVIKECFPQLHNWNVKILATDISDEMLEKSSNGIYSQLEVNRGLPVRKLVRFFDRTGTNWQVKPELKELIEFRRMNLTSAWPGLGCFDIVFMRNVLIYFEQETKTDILNRVRRVVSSDGYLFLGSAETTIGLGVPFQREEIDASVCYRPIGK